MRLFRPVAHSHEAHGVNSATWYATAWALLLVTTPAQAANVGVLALAFGDPVAGIVGRRLGRVKLLKGKTLEGSLAFLVATALVGAVYLLWLGDVAIGAAVATAAFRWPRGCGRRDALDAGRRQPERSAARRMGVRARPSPSCTREVPLTAPDRSLRDMTDRVCIVTGANSGIGKEIARGLAARSAKVVMICRNHIRGETAQQEIQSSTGNANLQLFLCDLSSMASVQAVADQLVRRLPRIDVLVHNAGLINGSRRETTEGLENTFAVNHLAPFLLTGLLLGRLRAAANARIVNVSSRAHMEGFLDITDLQMERSYSPVACVPRVEARADPVHVRAGAPPPCEHRRHGERLPSRLGREQLRARRWAPHARRRRADAARSRSRTSRARERRSTSRCPRRSPASRAATSSRNATRDLRRSATTSSSRGASGKRAPGWRG
jgi:hypothetical protein